jgi:hypothetical protein
MIPKRLIQTNLTSPDNRDLMKLSKHFVGWSYKNFSSDEERIIFFTQNPIKDFPDIIEKYNRLKGAHKSDIFRYYYLYLNGGCYLDDDAMVYEDIEKIIENYNFVCVESNFFKDFSHIFNGFICTTQKNIIMYKALQHLYNVDYDVARKNYQFACIELYNIVKQSTEKIKIYREVKEGYKCVVYDKKIILAHYYQYKKIPKKYKYIFSLTTIPSRFNKIYLTIESLISQTIKPDKIIINIPKKYNFRIQGQICKKDIDFLYNKYKRFNLVINIIDNDYGPGTKLLGLFNILNFDDKNTYIILVDDDMIYKNYLIEFFSNQKNDVASFYSYKIKDITIGQAADLFFIKSNLLKNFLNYYNKIKDFDYINYHDDFYISYYFYLMNKKIVRLPLLYNKSVYEIHTLKDSLHLIKNKYSRENLNKKIYNILSSLDFSELEKIE